MGSVSKWLVITALLLLAAGGAALWALKAAEPRLRQQIVDSIEDKYHAKSELEFLEVSLFPRVQVTGRNLRLRQLGIPADIPPLISVSEFQVHASLSQLLSKEVRIREVVLKGLVIHIPPKTDRQKSQPAPVEKKPPASLQAAKNTSRDIVIESVVADGAILKILPKNKKKEPLEFQLDKVSVTNARDKQPLEFIALLKNAKPPGLIHTRGTFGPWNKYEPGETPVSGHYTFHEADLSVFEGISGILQSEGDYHGMLERIEVDGTTDTPDFKISSGNQAFHLATRFHSIVDGTNGDTFLQPIEAHLGETDFICKGGIFKKEGERGKTILLDVDLQKGRIEDLLSLVVATEPALVGKVKFKSKLEIPSEDKPVIERIRLAGNILIDNAEFTSNKVQQKIEKLSMRSRGQHEDSTNERIVSDLKADFSLRNGTVSFSSLTFTVPGAHVQLQGTYGVASEQIRFEGSLHMQAKLSETQTGIKSILLKVVDPFFRKGKKGTVLPIKVTGTPKDASFGLNF